jgi:hypothetical protein
MNDSNLDILITRVIDHRATPADWVELEGLARDDSSVWRELAMAQKQDAALAGAVRDAAGRAEAVALPIDQPQPYVFETARRRMRLVATWSGWAAAAVVTMAFVTNGFSLKGANPGTQTAGAVPTLGLPEMLNQYLEQGKKDGVVVGELPDRVVLDTTTTPDGRTEIVFVRQIVERARVNDLYKPTTDEAGNLGMVKVQLKVQGRKSSM